MNKCVCGESERKRNSEAVGVLCDERSSVDIIFFFNDTATTEIYTLSLHDALPIFVEGSQSKC